jgi:hypothetical protein
MCAKRRVVYLPAVRQMLPDRKARRLSLDRRLEGDLVAFAIVVEANGRRFNHPLIERLMSPISKQNRSAHFL